MSDVARYRPWPCLDGAEMQYSDQGDYVLHDDYTALRALVVKQNEALKKDAVC